MTAKNISPWPLTVLLIFVVLCTTAFMVVHTVVNHPYVIRVEMDNNTRAALESINYSAMQPARACECNCHTDTPYYDPIPSYWNWTLNNSYFNGSYWGASPNIVYVGKVT